MRAGLFALALLLAPFVARAEHPGPLVSPDWLEARLGDPDIVVLDIRSKIDGTTEADFGKAHIPGSVRCDYLRCGFRVEAGGVPGMLPTVAQLEALFGDLGIGEDELAVLVSGGVNPTDFGSAARVYWTLRYLGHDEVAILDGGFAGWTADPARPVESGPARIPEPELFEARIRPELLVDTADIEAAIREGGAVLVDARPAAQYVGRDRHPAAKAYGHLPSAWNLPQEAFFVPGTGRLLPKERLAEVLPEELRGLSGTIVSYCNTGHWAATDWFVLHELLGYGDVRLYDASMVGWTRDPARPVETGPGIMAQVRAWLERFGGS